MLRQGVGFFTFASWDTQKKKKKKEKKKKKKGGFFFLFAVDCSVHLFASDIPCHIHIIVDSSALFGCHSSFLEGKYTAQMSYIFHHTSLTAVMSRT